MTGFDSVFCPQAKIRGTIKGKSSNLPIVNAKIMISNGFSIGSNIETTSDASGNFSTNVNSIKFNVTIKSEENVKLGSFSISLDGDYDSSATGISSEISVSSLKNPAETFISVGVEEKTFYSFLGSMVADSALSALQMEDGGYILTGAANGDLNNISDKTPLIKRAGSTDCLIAKMNNSGSLEWFTFLGGAGVDKCDNVIKTKDGGLIAFGTSAGISTLDSKSPLQPYSGSSQFDGVLYKLNSTGSLEWYSFIGSGSTNRVVPAGIIQTSDETAYIITGYSQGAITTLGSTTTIVDHTGGGYDIFLAKVKIDGTGEWITYFGGTGSENVRTFAETIDGGFVITGNSNSTISSYAGVSVKIPYSSGGFDVVTMKYDSSGKLQWFTFFGGTGADGGNGIIQTKDGGFLLSNDFGIGVSSLAGVTPIKNHSGTGSCTIIKLKSNGDVDWFTFVGASGISTTCLNSIQLPDKSYIFSGTSMGNFTELDGITPFYMLAGGTSDTFLLKMSEFGSVTWYNVIGSSGTDSGTSVIVTGDGGYFLTGTVAGDIPAIESKTPLNSYTGPTPYSDLFFYKIKPDGKF